MVNAWWVTIINFVFVIFISSSRRLQNLVTLASSRGASTSSNTQIGEGLVKNTAKIKDRAVRACSPPDNKDVGKCVKYACEFAKSKDNLLLVWCNQDYKTEGPAIGGGTNKNDISKNYKKLFVIASQPLYINDNDFGGYKLWRLNSDCQ